MKKTLRTFVLITIVVLMCVGTVTIAFAVNIPAATSDFYVNDFAGVFTEDEKSKLMANATSLASEHDGIQVVVTTIKSLEGDTVENYAYQMYNQYGIGKDDMGLLILLATEDRQIRVEVGRAMEGYINDAKAGRFMDKYAIPYLKENEFNEGLISLQQAFITEIKSCVTSSDITENNGGTDININWGAGLFAIFIILATGGVIWLVIFFVNKIKKKRKEQQEYIQGLKDKIDGLNNRVTSLNSTIDAERRTNNNLKQEINMLQNQLDAKIQSLATFQNRHNKILKIYPDADKKVDEMIQAEKVARDKEAARKVDALIAPVISLKPDKELVGRLASIKYRIDNLSRDEASHLESDLSRFNNLYRKCCTLQREYEQKMEEERIERLTEQRKAEAADITKQLWGIISAVGIVSANDLSRLRSAQHLYDGLDRETRSYVDSSAISKIEELFRRAKRAEQEEVERIRREEEERRIRQLSSYSTSSYRQGSSGFGGSSFGGFGGRSGGGGASRGF